MKKQWKSFSELQIKRFRLFRENTQLISELYVAVMMMSSSKKFHQVIILLPKILHLSA